MNSLQKANGKKCNEGVREGGRGGTSHLNLSKATPVDRAADA